MSNTNDINFKGTGNDIDAEGHAAKAGRAATAGTGAGKPRVRW